MKYPIRVPRGKCHNKTESKTTVSLYLSRTLVEKARNHTLNLSRITENALSSIIDYLESQNIKQSSVSLTEGSLLRETSGRVDQPGMIATLASWRSRVQIPARPPSCLVLWFASPNVRARVVVHKKRNLLFGDWLAPAWCCLFFLLRLLLGFWFCCSVSDRVYQPCHYAKDDSVEQCVYECSHWYSVKNFVGCGWKVE